MHAPSALLLREKNKQTNKTKQIEARNKKAKYIDMNCDNVYGLVEVPSKLLWP